jgi:hypothetical protein
MERPAVDPGCLPAWAVGELPEPVAFARRNWWALIGPGLVMAGGSIGTGEWVIGARAAAEYQGALLWVVIISILGQVLLNTEAMRYTLCTGEPVLTGFLRTKPGPKFWILLYVLLDVGAWWPSLAGLAAQIIVVAVQGLAPGDQIDPQLVVRVSYAVFVVCAVLVLFGGKVYNTLQYVLGGKFLFVLGYLIVCDVFFVSLQTWGEIWGGLFDITRRPAQGVDWSLMAALAGFSGLGGFGNIIASNYVREKGWGMGGQVGAIASAVGGRHITLSHLGTICRMGPDTVRRFKGWMKYLTVDQYCLWVTGSVLGMMLPCLLGAEYLKTRLPVHDEWRWAAALAQDFGAAHGSALRLLTLICGLVIMVPGQFLTMDGIARRWTDALWSGSAWARRMDIHKAKYIYYGFVAAYVLWGISAFTFLGISAATMMKMAGSLANLSLAATMLHTLYVNRRFLPPALQPPLAKQVALFLAALFFLAMFGLVADQKIRELAAGHGAEPVRATALLIASLLVLVLSATACWSRPSVRRQ